jgi:ribosomal protein S27E
VIRHLVGGGPERRDVLTECSLTSALPGSLVTELEDVTCRECRASLVARGICRECGEETLVWSAGPVKLNGVADGRLAVRDVETQFYLGCETCSETLISGVSPDEVAAALTERRWRP